MPDPKKSLSNFEWRCLDLVRKAEKFIEDRKDNGLSPRNMKVAESHVEDLKDQFRRMNKKWQDDLEEKVFNDDENLHEELNNKVKDTKALVDKCVEDLENMLDKNESGASVQKAMKLENSFKPNPGLTISNTLEEFNAWKRAFVAYYGVNKEYLEAANPEIRRQFVNNCIDSKIQAAMITDDNPDHGHPNHGREGQPPDVAKRSHSKGSAIVYSPLPLLKLPSKARRIVWRLVDTEVIKGRRV